METIPNSSFCLPYIREDNGIGDMGPVPFIISYTDNFTHSFYLPVPTGISIAMFYIT